MSKNKVLSVVIPVYGYPTKIVELHKRLINTFMEINVSFEIIFVNDCCPKNSWEEIKKIVKNDENVIGIDLSKNCGQHSATKIGLKYAKSDYVVVMDCDLQDRPEEIKKFYKKIINNVNNEIDAVIGQRVKRYDNFYKKIISKLFYKIFAYLSGVNYDEKTTSFGIYSKKLIDSFLEYKQKGLSFGLGVYLAGYKKLYIQIQHDKNDEKTAYPFTKRLKFAYDTIFSISTIPLFISIKMGIMMFVISIFLGFYLILKYYIYGIAISGWTSIMVSIFFTGAMILFNIGVIGIYIEKILIEVYNRPESHTREIIKKNEL